MSQRQRREDGELSDARDLRHDSEHIQRASAITLCPRASILVGLAVLLVASPSWAGPPLSAYVLYGENGVFIGGASTISGLVGGKNALPADAQNASIRLAGEASINGDARSGRNVFLHNNAHITGNVLHPSGTTVILGAGASVGTDTVGDPELPALPPATNLTVQCAAAAAAADVNVSNGQTHTFSPGGVYGDVTAGGTTTVELNGAGAYVFNSITIGNDSKLSLTGTTPVTIYVCGFARLGRVSVLPTSLTRTDLKVEVQHAGTRAFTAGTATNWIGDVFAPFGQIVFGGGGCCSFFHAHFVAGLDVKIQHGVQGENGELPCCAVKSGQKFNDTNGNGIFEPGLGETPLGGWLIHIFDTATNGAGFHTHVQTDALGKYEVVLPPGTFTACEELQDGWLQTAPNPDQAAGACQLHTHLGNPGPRGYTFTITDQPHPGNDFGNQFNCPEDPLRAAWITRVVSNSIVPGSSPAAHETLQDAYDAALASGHPNEVIGLFRDTSENVVLGGDKANIIITQCTVARITAADPSLPVWTISNAQKLRIIGSDAAGGTDGWLITTNGHEVRGVRANGGSGYGIRILGNTNTVSVNAVSGNTLGGILIEGDGNTLKSGGAVSDNQGDGVRLIATANGNTVSIGNIRNNGGNGVRVDGAGNTVKANGRVDSNKLNGILVNGDGNTITNNAAGSDKGKGNILDGFKVVGNGNTVESNRANANGGVGFDILGANNKLKGNQSNQTANGGAKENVAQEYCFADGTTQDLTGNKKDTLSFIGTIAGAPKKYAAACYE